MTEVGSIFFDAELDDTGLVAATERAAKRASQEAEVKFTADADFTDLAAKAKLAAARAKTRIEVEARLNTKGFFRDSRGLFRNNRGLVASFEDLTNALGDFGRTGSGPGGVGTTVAFIGRAAATAASGVGAMAAAVLIATPYVISFAGAVVALASALASVAIGGALAAATNIAAIGAAALTAKIGLTGLDGAFTAVAKAQEEQARTGKISKETLKEQKRALDALAPSARDFVQTITDITPVWKSLARTVQQRLFKGLADDIRGLTTNLGFMDVLRSGFRGIAGVINDAARNLLDFLGSTRGIDTLRSIFGGLQAILKPLVGAAGAFGRGLLTLFTASLPFGKRLAKAIEGIAGDFEKWATTVTKNKSFQKFLQDAFDDGSKLWDIIKKVGSIIATVFSGGGKSLGSDLLTSIDDLLTRFDNFLKKNPKAIQNFFKDVGDNVKGAADAIRAAWPSIRELLDNLQKNADTFNKVASGVSEFADALGALTAISTTGIVGEIGQLTGAIKDLQDGTTTINAGDLPGFIRSIVESLTGLKINPEDSITIDWGALFTHWATDIGAGLLSITQQFRDAFNQLVIDIADIITNIGWDDIFNALPTSVRAVILAVEGIFQGLVDFLVGNSLIPDLIASIVALFAGLPGQIATAIGNLALTFVTWVAGVPAIFVGLIAQIIAPFINLAGQIIIAAGDLAGAFLTWVSSLPGTAGGIVIQVVSRFVGLAGKIIVAAGSIASQFASWLAPLPGQAAATARAVVGRFAGLAGRMIRNAGSISRAFAGWIGGLSSQAAAAASAIVRQFAGLNSRIVAAIGPVVVHARVVVDQVAASGLVSGGAGGGGRAQVSPVIAAQAGWITRGPQLALIGEAGPEAVIPLRRTQSLDPDVASLLRSVAASRGIGGGGTRRAGDLVSRDGVIVVEEGASLITVVVPTGDPQAAAMAVVNRLALVRTVG